MSRLSDIMQALPGLTEDQIETVMDGCRAVLAGRDRQPDREQAGGETGGKRRRRKGRAWSETKEINGHEYAYMRWRDGGHKRSKYLGRAE